MKCPCAHDKPEPFHRESWQRKWNAAFDKLPKYLQDEILRDPTGDAAHNFNQLLMKRNPVKSRKIITVHREPLISGGHWIADVEGYLAARDLDKSKAIEKVKSKIRHHYPGVSIIVRENPVKQKKMGSPWRFVKGAKPGFRKLKNIRTGKVRLIRMAARKASRRHRRNPSRRVAIEQTMEEQLSADLKRFIRKIANKNRPVVFSRGRTDDTIPAINSTPIEIVEGASPPVLRGRGYWKTGFRGRGGFTKTLYTPSTLRIEVGSDWLGGSRNLESFLTKSPFSPYTKENPVTVRKLGSGAYRVRGERRKIHAFGTTKARATRQARLIRAVEHGWKPTGQPALAVRKKLKAMRKPARVGHRLFAHRKGKHWTLRTAPRGGLVIAKHLTLEQLRSRARKLSYKIRSL